MDTAFLSSQTDDGAGGLYASACARISTYSSHLSRFKNCSVLILVNDGFYCRGQSSEIRCYSCGYQFDFDKDPDNPIAAHKLRCSSCPHIQLQYAGDGDDNLQSDETINGNSLRGQVEDAKDVNRGSRKPTDKVLPITDNHLELCRLQSFYRWPQNAAVSPEELAYAGFFYTGSHDRVQCAFCKGVLRCWEHGDKPLAEHLRHFPDCPFLEDPASMGNVMLGEENDAMLATVQMRNMASDAPPSSGIMMDRPVNPRYANIDERLSSLTDFPLNSFQKPEELAHAGLYYTGQIDVVRCFFCNVLLHNWEAQDDPWVQHIKASSKCGFVRMINGEEYIKQVLENKHKSRKHTTGTSLRPRRHPLSLNHRVNPHDHVVRSMASPVVQSVLASRIASEDTIRKVVQKRLQELGEDFLTVESLVNAVTENQEEERISSESANTVPDSDHNVNSPVESMTLDSQGDLENLQRDNERLKAERRCKVCLEESAHIVFLYCGHLVCCSTCAPALTTCPVCRENILGTILVDL